MFDLMNSYISPLGDWSFLEVRHFVIPDTTHIHRVFLQKPKGDHTGIDMTLALVEETSSTLVDKLLLLFFLVSPLFLSVVLAPVFFCCCLFLWLHLFAAYITPSSLPSPMSVGHGQ